MEPVKIEIPEGMTPNKRTRQLLHQLENNGQVVQWDGDDGPDDYKTLEQMTEIMDCGRVIRPDTFNVCQMNKGNLSSGRFIAILE